MPTPGDTEQYRVRLRRSDAPATVMQVHTQEGTMLFHVSPDGTDQGTVIDKYGFLVNYVPLDSETATWMKKRLDAEKEALGLELPVESLMQDWPAKPVTDGDDGDQVTDEDLEDADLAPASASSAGYVGYGEGGGAPLSRPSQESGADQVSQEAHAEAGSGHVPVPKLYEEVSKRLGAMVDDLEELDWGNVRPVDLRKVLEGVIGNWQKFRVEIFGGK